MENIPPGVSLPPNGSERAINTDLIQRALDSGRSLIAAYTPRGMQVIQNKLLGTKYILSIIDEYISPYYSLRMF